MDQYTKFLTQTVEQYKSNNIPREPGLKDMKLHTPWVLYLYDKQRFKKMANKPNFDSKPHSEICTINTVNDLIYILQLMQVKCEPKIKIGSEGSNKINLDMNDYIIMRKGIEPIWEDPKNSDGGTFTVKMNHDKGYDVWAMFVMYMLGETLSPFDMDHINGITVSYISDASSFHGSTSPLSTHDYTYIKIWDGDCNRSTKEEFMNILPMEIVNKLRGESLMYSKNNKKRNYGDKNIIDKLHQPINNHQGRERGAFRDPKDFRGGRGGGNGGSFRK